MFYEPGKTPHNLPYDPFKSCVIPRPIGWISTISPSGKSQNLAPYSQFQNLTFDPPYVMFSANQTLNGTRKDTVINAESTGVFCWNMATWDLRHAVNLSAEQVEYGVDEFGLAGVTAVPSTVLGEPKCPMVAESPIRFECTYHSTIRLPGNPPMGTVDVVIGRVVGVHIADGVLDESGKIDVLKIRPIARCGYYNYTVINELFDMVVPGDPRMLRGLEGSSEGNRKTLEENRLGAQGKEEESSEK
ncbi:hypothetical protein V5O48_010168 [Marasmius crinis-equi]|uniref:Flavin reductase like domain-containing protein n=1 Tax=Marasmius crinis-equi TaxID=585013 RepID=A0ABR3F999_9AGAR